MANLWRQNISYRSCREFLRGSWKPISDVAVLVPWQSACSGFLNEGCRCPPIPLEKPQVSAFLGYFFWRPLLKFFFFDKYAFSISNWSKPCSCTTAWITFFAFKPSPSVSVRMIYCFPAMWDVVSIGENKTEYGNKEFYQYVLRDSARSWAKHDFRDLSTLTIFRNKRWPVSWRQYYD